MSNNLHTHTRAHLFRNSRTYTKAINWQPFRTDFRSYNMCIYIYIYIYIYYICLRMCERWARELHGQ